MLNPQLFSRKGGGFYFAQQNPIEYLSFGELFSSFRGTVYNECNVMILTLTWTTLTTKKSESGRVAPIRRQENRLSSLANRPGPSSQTEMSEKTKLKFFIFYLEPDGAKKKLQKSPECVFTL